MINLDDYVLIRPDYVVEKKSDVQKFYDIEVEHVHDFYIVSKDNSIKILSHNCDGFHIASLLINLFYKWFPAVVKRGSLGILKIPLVSIGDGKKRKYFWDLDEFKKSKPSGTARYLKGLGSLALDDWEWVMKDKSLWIIEESSDSKEKLEMAFGDSSEARKKWLSN